MHSPNPLERLSGIVQRRTAVVGVLPNEGAAIPQVDANILAEIDEWAFQRVRYIKLESAAQLSDDALATQPPKAS